MVARLEADVRRGPFGPRERLFEGDDLRVGSTEDFMEALADDLVVLHEHAPDHRIRVDLSPSLPRDPPRPLEVRGVRWIELDERA